MPASSSSSEDEDLSIFASCAVSADQLGKDASLQASKRAKASARRSSAAAAVASRPAVQQEGHGILKQQEEPVNDLIGAKIAAALDAILERQLEVAGDAAVSSPAKRKAAAAAPGSVRKKHKAATDPVQDASTAAAKVSTSNIASSSGLGPREPAGSAEPVEASREDGTDDDDGTGVQLFRSVPKGTPCIVQQPAQQLDGLLQQQQQQQQQAGGSFFGSGSLPRKQSFREQIPRLSLAERSRQGNKQQHEAVLAALAVDGQALMEAAAAAGYAAAAAGGGAGQPLAGGASSSGKSSGIKGGGAWLEGWRQLKGQQVQGVVVDAKPWVPFDVRAAKLLGTAAP